MRDNAAHRQDRPASKGRLGLIVAVLALAADQAHKAWMLHGFGITETDRVEVLPVLDLVLVWNRGISYGLMQQNSELGRWLLVGISLAAVVVLSVWLARARTGLTAVALGLVIGGAIGNAIDRIAYGAVADFFLFHIGKFQWYVFNLADIWIVAGAAGLVYESVFSRKTAAMDG